MSKEAPLKVTWIGIDPASGEEDECSITTWTTYSVGLFETEEFAKLVNTLEDKHGVCLDCGGNEIVLADFDSADEQIPKAIFSSLVAHLDTVIT